MKKFFWLIGLVTCWGLQAQEPPAPGAEPPSRPVEWLKRAEEAERRLKVEGSQVIEIYLGNRVERIEARIWRDGIKAMRVELLSPPTRRGEVLLFKDRRVQHYIPDKKELIEPHEPPLAWAPYLQGVGYALRKGFLSAELVGNEMVADHPTVMIELRWKSPPPPPPGAPSPTGSPGPPPGEPRRAFMRPIPRQRLWIDRATGLILRREIYTPEGERRLRIEFTRVKANANIPPEQFKLDLPSDVKRPRPQWQQFPTVAAAQGKVPFKIRVPVPLPEGITMQGVYVLPFHDNPLVAIRYTDGRHSITFFQTQRKGERFKPPIPDRFRNSQINTHFWEDGDRWFGLVSPLPKEQLERIARLVQ